MLTLLVIVGLTHALVAVAAARPADAGPPYGTAWLVDLARLRAERNRRMGWPRTEQD